MHTASLKLEVLCKRPDALVRLEAPCDGAWTHPLAKLVLLVSYMPLAHGGQPKNRLDIVAPRTHRHRALGFEAAVITAIGPPSIATAEPTQN